MAAKTFDEITQDFLAAAQRENLPTGLRTTLVNLYRGPDSSIDAFGTWTRWYHALPGDPITNLTISDIHKKFQNGTEDLRLSNKALDEVWAYLMEPANTERASESARRGDWLGLRTHIADHLESRPPISGALLRCLDTPMALGQKGAVRELLVECLRRSHEATATHAAFLDSLEHGGVALAHETLRTGVGAKGLGGAIAWTVGGTIATAAVAIGCGVGGYSIAAAGCGLAAAGYGVYCLNRLRELAW